MSKKNRKAKPAPAPSRAEVWKKEHAPMLGLATLAGVLWFTACADFDIWIFAWFASVPLLWVVEHAKTTKRAVYYSWFSGIVGNAGGFYWIIGSLERFGHLPWIVAALLFLLLAAYQATVMLLFAWVTRTIRQRTTLPMTLVAPVVMVTFELVVPFLFPYYLAITQAWQLHVIQIADLTGPLGVSGMLMLVNGAIYDLATERRKRLVPALAAAAILAGALLYGHVRLGQIRDARAAAPHIKVGVVQPNVSFDMMGVEILGFAQLSDLLDCSRQLEAERADLILWTEGSFPYALGPRDLQPERSTGMRKMFGFDVPLVMGAITREDDPEAYPHNSALMLDKEGRFTARFDKIFLFMFGEYIPGLETFPWIKKFMPRGAGHVARGKKTVTFPFQHDGKEYRLGPMICYEDILPTFGRKLAAQHPHLLVNITNDACFGDTSEPWEHLALSVYRTVELRTDLVRAVNTGVSAWVDATGRVHEKTYAVDPKKPPKGADKKLGEAVLLEGGHTVYARVGDLFGYLNLAGTIWLWLLLPRYRSGRRGGGAARRSRRCSRTTGG